MATFINTYHIFLIVCPIQHICGPEWKNATIFRKSLSNAYICSIYYILYRACRPHPISQKFFLFIKRHKSATTTNGILLLLSIYVFPLIRCVVPIDNRHFFVCFNGGEHHSEKGKGNQIHLTHGILDVVTLHKTGKKKRRSRL